MIINSNFPCESFNAKAAWYSDYSDFRQFQNDAQTLFVWVRSFCFPVWTSTRCQLAPLSSFPLTAFLMRFFTLLNFDKTKNVSVVTRAALLACQQGSTSTWWELVPPSMVVVPQKMIDGPATTTCVLPAAASCWQLPAVQTRLLFPVAWQLAPSMRVSRHISVLAVFSQILHCGIS